MEQAKRLYRVEFAGCPDDYVLATNETVAIDAVREILRKRMDDAAISFVGIRLLSPAPLYVESNQ